MPLVRIYEENVVKRFKILKFIAFCSLFATSANSLAANVQTVSPQWANCTEIYGWVWHGIYVDGKKQYSWEIVRYECVGTT